LQDRQLNQTGNAAQVAGPAVLLVYLFAASMLMVTDHRTQMLDKLRIGLGIAAYPILQVVNLPVQASRWAGETLSQKVTLQNDNKTLNKKLLVAEAELALMTALKEENQRLRALLQTSEKLGQDVLVAELIAVDLDPYRHRIAINKGQYHNVYMGQPVVIAGGILGQIETLNLTHAYVMMISDPGHAVPVVINRTGLRTIAYGTGNTENLLLKDVSPSTDIVAGDLLVSSGLGGRFPAGFPVATVATVKRDPGDAFLQIDATPTAALSQAREVLLVWPQQPVLESQAELPESNQP